LNFNSDIDIDFADRSQVLKHIEHIPSAMRNVKPIRKHATGIHVTKIPFDPINKMSSIDYSEAEKRGYIKLDFLNVHVYSNVRSEQHLINLMRDPNWGKLKKRDFVEKLIHLNNQFDNIQKMPEPIDSIPKLAMFLAVIRPGKKHLLGKTWNEVSKTIWEKDSTGGYVFKKAHAISYSWLTAVHINILSEQEHE
jgi:hypothetical protein